MYLLNTALTYLLFAYKKSILEATQRNDYISMNDTITTGLTNVNVDELLKILKESENDMKYNRVAPISTTFSDLRARQYNH